MHRDACIKVLLPTKVGFRSRAYPTHTRAAADPRSFTQRRRGRVTYAAANNDSGMLRTLAKNRPPNTKLGRINGQSGERNRVAHLLIMRPIRLISDLSNGGESGLGLPLYVGLNASHGRKIEIASSLDPASSSSLRRDGDAVPSSENSASQLRPLFARPSPLLPGISSLSVTRYRFGRCESSAFAECEVSEELVPVSIVMSRPSYADRSQCSVPLLCWDAKPAPPRVLVSRHPQNRASLPSLAVSRWEMLEPPRTRSSEVVQSFSFHCLYEPAKQKQGHVSLLFCAVDTICR